MAGLVIANKTRARARYIDDAEQMARARRALFSAENAGQALTYQEKLKEASDQLAGNRGPFPNLQAEADARSITLAAVTAEVVTLNNERATASTKIEGALSHAKATINGTDDSDAWLDALKVLKAALPPAPETDEPDSILPPSGVSISQTDTDITIEGLTEGDTLLIDQTPYTFTAPSSTIIGKPRQAIYIQVKTDSARANFSEVVQLP